jgi:hypothetical protein
MAVTVKNPRTGEVWPLSNAIWSIWHYVLETRDIALEARALAKAAGSASGLSDDDLAEIQSHAKDGAREALADLRIVSGGTEVQPTGYVSGV